MIAQEARGMVQTTRERFRSLDMTNMVLIAITTAGVANSRMKKSGEGVDFIVSWHGLMRTRGIEKRMQAMIPRSPFQITLPE